MIGGDGINDESNKTAPPPHEYFVHPTVIKNGRYVAPLAPGNGTEMKLDECMKYLHKD